MSPLGDVYLTEYREHNVLKSLLCTRYAFTIGKSV